MKILFVTIILITSVNVFAALDLDRENDVINMLKFLKDVKPESYNYYRPSFKMVYDFCQASENGNQLNLPAKNEVVYQFDTTINMIYDDLVKRGNLKLGMKFSWILGAKLPKLKHSKEIQENIFIYLKDIKTSLNNDNYNRCNHLMKKIEKIEIPNNLVASS